MLISCPPKLPPPAFLEHIQHVVREQAGAAGEGEPAEAQEVRDLLRKESMDMFREMKALFARPGPREAMFDHYDGVARCPMCQWEVVDAACVNCEWRAEDYQVRQPTLFVLYIRENIHA
jgi:hypothetical protein